MVSEKRKNKRQTLTYDSSIVLLGDKTKLECRLGDISSTGARIYVDKPKELPDDFVLMLSERGKVMRLCHVVRRDKKHVGVVFRSS